MRVAGKAIAPLFMETFAFCGGDLSRHLSLYMGSIQNKWTHLAYSRGDRLLRVSVFITSMNAFMNQPQGFELVDGVFTNVNPFVAMFNPATPTKVSHVLASALRQPRAGQHSRFQYIAGKQASTLRKR